MTPAWYAIYTDPGCEDRVIMGLFGRGIPYFCPKARRWSTHARKRHVVERALFTRYVFAFVRGAGDFHRIRSANGVYDFVRSGAHAFPIPGAVLDRLMALEDVGAFDETRERAQTRTEVLRPVLEGKLGDLRDRLAAASEDDRIMVLLADAGIVDARRARAAA